MIKFIQALVLILFSSNIYAGMYKCINAQSETSFQSRPCTNSDKETKVKYRGIQYTQLEQCKIDCSGTYQTCIRKQMGNFYNTRGTKICKQERKACDTTCVDPEEGKLLTELAEIERSAYKRDRKHQRETDRINRNHRRRMDKIDCREAKNKLSDLETEYYERRIDKADLDVQHRYRDKRESLEKTIRRKC